MEPVVQSIEECEGKHPSEMLSSFDHTIPLDYREHHFGVRLASEAGSFRCERRSQLQKVVDFTVENDDVAPLLRHHRLASFGGQIDDGKSPMTEREPDSCI